MNGAAIAVTETFRTSKNRSFVVDSTGRILQKTENGGTQHYFYANDKPVGSSGALAAADFDYNYTPVTDQYPALVPGNYVVSAGDTLRGIALAVYGDAQLWYLIADANGLQTDAELTVGRNLTIPNKVTNLRNAYDTYKPYEPGKIIGDLTPTLPEPPPPDNDDGGCGGLGGIFVAIIAVVVAFVFQQWYVLTEVGAALSAAAAVGTPVFEAGLIAMSVEASATIVGATIGGALGNIASQAVGMALGIQDKFSWGNVALAAIGGGLSAGLGASGSPLSGSGLGMTVARAMVGSAITQGVGVAVGLQDKFDWKGVAAAGVGAGVGYGMNQILPQAGPGNSFGSVMRDTAIGFASGVARQAVYGGKINFANVAADAFGNALGNSLAYSSTAVVSTAQQTQGEGPWSAADYRNGADIESDLAASRRENPSGWAFADDVARRRAALANVWSNPAAAGIDTPAMSGSPAPAQIQAGTAAAKGFWGVAAERLGPGATNAEIQDYAQRLMSANPGVRFDRMRTDTVLTLPDESTSTSAAARREWERSNALAAAREQERIEAAQRAAANELRRETSRGAILAAVSSAPAMPIVSLGGDVAPSEFEVSMGLGQTGQAFHDPDGGPRFVSYVARGINAAVNVVAEPVAQLIDTGMATIGAGYTAITGKPANMPMISHTWAAVQNGATTTELLHATNPVYGLLVTGYEVSQAVQRGDAGALYEASGALIGGGLGFRAATRLPSFEPGLFSAGTRAFTSDALYSLGEHLSIRYEQFSYKTVGAPAYVVPPGVANRVPLPGEPDFMGPLPRPSEPYNRRAHYGTTPTQADRKAFGANSYQVVDHDPPLVVRYYYGDLLTRERPGYLMTPEERAASGSDRTRMALQPRDDSNVQGAAMANFAKQMKRFFGF